MMGDKRFRTVVTVIAGLGAAAAIAGCGGSSSNSGGTSSHSGGGPAAKLKRAAYVSANASGYKVAIALHETVKAPASGSTPLTVAATGTGSFSPGQHQGAFTMNMTIPTSSGPQSLQLQMVLDHATVYVRMPPELASKLPGGKPWVYVRYSQLGRAAGIPELGSLLNSGESINDPGQYLDYLRVTAGGSIQDLGQETVNGVSTTHYHALVDIAKLPDAVPASGRRAAEQLLALLQRGGASTTEMPIDVWIDGSNQVRRIHLAYNLTVNGASAGVDMTENMLEYGPQPAPTPPPAGEATNAISLLPTG